MGKTTLTVSDETLERFGSLKSELDDVQTDCPNHTNESFLNALLDTWEQVGRVPEDGPETITDALADDELAIIGTEHALIEELAGRLDGGGDVDTQALVDDLVTQLPPRIADEIESRRR